MVNPSKWANLKSNFLKFHHRNQVILGIEKARKMAYFRAFLALLSCRLSLAELRSATSGFEADLPAAVLQCERGWRALKICGVLDFALVGILAKISSLLANAGISIFAVSTYNTDYILIKESHLQKAAAALRTNGYQITA